jgi:DNA repair protein RadC
MPDEPAPIVDNAAEAATILGPLLAGAGAGTVAVLHLDRERRLIAATNCADTEGELPVREIMSDALRIGSVTLVVGRTAPAGGLDAYSGPSSGVRELADAGWRLGIGLTDLLIFSTGSAGACASWGWYSTVGGVAAAARLKAAAFKRKVPRLFC